MRMRICRTKEPQRDQYSKLLPRPSGRAGQFNKRRQWPAIAFWVIAEITLSAVGVWFTVFIQLTELFCSLSWGLRASQCLPACQCRSLATAATWALLSYNVHCACTRSTLNNSGKLRCQCIEMACAMRQRNTSPMPPPPLPPPKRNDSLVQHINCYSRIHIAHYKINRAGRGWAAVVVRVCVAHATYERVASSLCVCLNICHANVTTRESQRILYYIVVWLAMYWRTAPSLLQYCRGWRRRRRRRRRQHIIIQTLALRITYKRGRTICRFVHRAQSYIIFERVNNVCFYHMMW